MTSIGESKGTGGVGSTGETSKTRDTDTNISATEARAIDADVESTPDVTAAQVGDTVVGDVDTFERTASLPGKAADDVAAPSIEARHDALLERAEAGAWREDPAAAKSLASDLSAAAATLPADQQQDFLSSAGAPLADYARTLSSSPGLVDAQSAEVLGAITPALRGEDATFAVNALAKGLNTGTPETSAAAFGALEQLTVDHPVGDVRTMAANAALNGSAETLKQGLSGQLPGVTTADVIRMVDTSGGAAERDRVATLGATLGPDMKRQLDAAGVVAAPRPEGPGFGAMMGDALGYAGGVLKGYATGAVNTFINEPANLVNGVVNAGLSLTPTDFRFRTDLGIQPTSQAEADAQNAVAVASVVTGVAGLVKSAPSLARATDAAVDWARNLGRPAAAAEVTAAARLRELGVIDPNRIYVGIMDESGAMRFRNTTSDPVADPGFWPRNRSHLAIAEEMGLRDQIQSQTPHGLRAFTVVPQADGRLGVAFFSRSVNEAPGYGGTRYGNGGYVFEDSRQPVLDRLAELTGQPTFDLTLARWENTPGIDFGH
jgi:hypothetical protein